MTNSKSWSADEKDDQAWDDLFMSRMENVGNYLNPEGPEEEMQDFGSASRIEVTTHRDDWGLNHLERGE